MGRTVKPPTSLCMDTPATQPGRAARLLRLVTLAAIIGLPAAAAVPGDSYDVIWDSPSANHHGSMPLGNGDIALNAWMTREGDLHFYIAKTDAWDDNARLLKVGKVRLHFEPNPVLPDGPFRQELNLSEGCLEIPAGCKIRLWVDANHPVIEVTVESARPV
jgi:alpha-L-fucosidase 2